MCMTINSCRVGCTLRSSFHEITRSSDHLVLQGHVKYHSFYITTNTSPMDTKLCTKR